jgi:hypothetical protein
MIQSRREVLRWAAGGLVAMVGLLPRKSAAAAEVVTSSFFTEFTSLAAIADDLLLTVSGQVHVVVQACPADQLAPVDPCRIYLNLAQASGIDQNGVHYRLDGSYIYAQEPVLFGGSYDFPAFFRLTPTDPCKGCAPTDPCRCSTALRFLISVGPTGVVTGDDVEISSHHDGGGDVVVDG